MLGCKPGYVHSDANHKISYPIKGKELNLFLLEFLFSSASPIRSNWLALADWLLSYLFYVD